MTSLNNLKVGDPVLIDEPTISAGTVLALTPKTLTVAYHYRGGYSYDRWRSDKRVFNRETGDIHPTPRRYKDRKETHVWAAADAPEHVQVEAAKRETMRAAWEAAEKAKASAVTAERDRVLAILRLTRFLGTPWYYALRVDNLVSRYQHAERKLKEARLTPEALFRHESREWNIDDAAKTMAALHYEIEAIEESFPRDTHSPARVVNLIRLARRMNDAEALWRMIEQATINLTTTGKE